MKVYFSVALNVGGETASVCLEETMVWARREQNALSG